MEIYSEEELKRQKARKKRAKIAMAAVSGAALIVCVVLFCVVTPLNEKTCRAAAIVIASAAACFDVYVCGYVLPYIRPDQFGKQPGSKAGKVARNILRQLLLYLLCIILSAIFTTFIFNRITDTVPEKKVSVFAEVRSVKSAELEMALDRDLPEGIKMVKVRTFDYDLFGFAGSSGADIFIVEESRAEEYMEHFAPAAEFLEPRDIFKYYMHDGEPYGVLIHSGAVGGASEYFAYEDGKDYYMFFGNASAHPGTDGAASYVADQLLKMK